MFRFIKRIFYKEYREIYKEGFNLKPCPNPSCKSLNLDLHRGFDYVWCKDCGTRGPTFDGHLDDSVVEWNSFIRES